MDRTELGDVSKEKSKRGKKGKRPRPEMITFTERRVKEMKKKNHMNRLRESEKSQI